MKSLFIILSLLTTSFCFSQRTITGTVSDVNGKPILGSTIKVKGTFITTVSDLSGKYSIATNQNDFLEFSFFGYKTKEIKVENQEVINIELKEDPAFINVYLGRGREQDLKLITGINYETYGFHFSSKRRIIPRPYSFDFGAQSGFNGNYNYNLGLERNITFKDYTSIDLKAAFETANFNDNQYHSYKISLSKLFSIISATKHQQFSLISGYMNYDGRFDSKKIGYGLGMKREMWNLIFSSSFIHWQDFNEFNTQIAYYINNFNLNAGYKHLASYEEFQLGLGYSFYF